MWNDWQIIYQHSWTKEFSAIVRKRLPYSNESVDETMNEVRQELAIKFNDLTSEPSSVNPYIRAAFRNTLEDYLRKKEGYPRPPEWIKKLGAGYERVYKLLCLESRAVNDIQAIMQSMFQYTRSFIEQIISEVRAGAVNCGTWRDKVSIENAITEVEQVGQCSANQSTPDAILEDMDSEAVVSAILGQSNSSVGHSEHFRDLLTVLAKCPINDDERLLLRLIYTDECSISEAARRTQLKDSEARKTLKQLYQRLKQTLISHGLTEL